MKSNVVEDSSDILFCVRLLDECVNVLLKKSSRDKTGKNPIRCTGRKGIASNTNSIIQRLYCIRSDKCFLNIRFEIVMIPIKNAIKTLHNKN